MDIVIKLNTDNDAFFDAPSTEVAQILIKLGIKVYEEGLRFCDDRPLQDINGNTCGSVEVSDD
jgi:hypothetical protein